MEDRKKQLELKKQKLAELKEQKRLREESKRAKLLEHMDKRGIDPSAKAGTTDETMEQILLDVGIESSPPSKKPEGAGGSLTARDASPGPRAVFSSSRPTTLAVTVPVQVNIAPKESVAYSKTTQTSGEETTPAHRLHSHGGVDSFGGTPSQDWWEDEEGAGLRPPTNNATDEVATDSDLSPTANLPPSLAGLVSNLVRSVEEVWKAQGGAEAKAEETVEEEKRKPELSEEEKAQLVADPEFQTFFRNSANVLERALADPMADFVFADYAADSDRFERADTGASLHLVHSFFNEQLCKGRCVSSLDFSEAYPELMAVAYSDNPDVHVDSAGLVLVWNTKFPKKASPEFVFHSPSRVTAVRFSKFHPNYILGGTYSGQICLWDNRQSKKTPVQKTPLSTAAHTHPVYSLRVVGTQNAHNLISLSTDGRMCAWSVDMLSAPHHTLDLTAKQSRQVAATCLDFPHQDVNNFLVGAEDGGVYSGCRHGNKAGIAETFEGHPAPVTGLCSHRAVGQVDLSHMFLTSSFDWSVKLWSTKEPRPLHSFDNHSDYVMDVAWSPVHPALFACCDASGTLEVWNLNADTELPAAVTVSEGRTGLFRLLWSANGQHIVVGEASGAVSLYDVHESLASPRPDAWNKLSRTLMELKQAQVEAEELSQAMALSSAASIVASPR